MRLAWAIVILLTFLIIHFVNFIIWDPVSKSIGLDEVQSQLQNGDLILFKALDHYSSLAIMCYFTHIGMIYMIDDVPYILEATYRIERDKPHIVLTNFSDRVKQYRGFMYYKPLSQPLTETMLNEYQNFVEYAQKNMYYETRIIRSALKKAIGLEELGDGTNCGELLFLALQQMDLIDARDKSLHHLKYLCDVKKLKHNYAYNESVKINYSYLHTCCN